MRALAVLSLAVLASAGTSAQSVTPSPYPYGPTTVVPNFVACTDLPTVSTPAAALRIVAGHSPSTHRVFRPGEILVIGGAGADALEPGQRFFIRRLQPSLSGERPSVKHPGAIRTAGWLTVTAVDARNTLARIDFACDTVDAGDYLEPFTETPLPQPVAAAAPQFADMGVVLFGGDRRQQFGAGDFLNIDRGTDAGMAPGMRVTFFRDRRNGTPLVELGEGLVLEAAAATAKLVITRTRDVIFAGDYAAAQR